MHMVFRDNLFRVQNLIGKYTQPWPQLLLLLYSYFMTWNIMPWIQRDAVRIAHAQRVFELVYIKPQLSMEYGKPLLRGRSKRAYDSISVVQKGGESNVPLGISKPHWIC